MTISTTNGHPGTTTFTIPMHRDKLRREGTKIIVKIGRIIITRRTDETADCVDAADSKEGGGDLGYEATEVAKGPFPNMRYVLLSLVAKYDLGVGILQATLPIYQDI